MNTTISPTNRFKYHYIFLPLILVLLLVVFVPGAQAGEESSEGNYHRVRYGETLSQIAVYYGTTVQSIAYANGIVNPNLIYAGMLLYIPHGYGYGYGSGSGQGGYGYGYFRAYHTVGYGDTLLRIGAWYGVNPYAIAQANNIYNLNLIYRGQTLCIP
jgi:LysM repeat protein